MNKVKTSILYSYVVSFNLYSAGIYQIDSNILDNLNPNIHISDLEIDNNSTYFHQMHMMMLNMIFFIVGCVYAKLLLEDTL